MSTSLVLQTPMTRAPMTNQTRESNWSLGLGLGHSRLAVNGSTKTPCYSPASSTGLRGRAGGAAVAVAPVCVLRRTTKCADSSSVGRRVRVARYAVSTCFSGLPVSLAIRVEAESTGFSSVRSLTRSPFISSSRCGIVLPRSVNSSSPRSP